MNPQTHGARLGEKVGETVGETVGSALGERLPNKNNKQVQILDGENDRENERTRHLSW